MTALTRFERLDELFPEMFRRVMRPLATSSLDAPAEIRIDVSEDDKGYEVRAEIPGVKKEDIRVSVDRNFVSISAEVKRETQQPSGEQAKNARNLLTEIYYGSASRSFALGHEVDEKAAVAKYEHGHLVLQLPKKQESSSRKLTIQ